MGRGGGEAADGGRDAGWLRGTSMVWVGCRGHAGVGRGGAGRGGKEGAKEHDSNL
jgi:hypothetical protein